VRLVDCSRSGAEALLFIAELGSLLSTGWVTVLITVDCWRFLIAKVVWARTVM